MYCPLINRFRGALIGSALAEGSILHVDEDGSQFHLTHRLIQEGQAISSITSCLHPFSEKDAVDPAVPMIAHVVLLTLMLHDSQSERLQALQSSAVPLGLGLGLLSDALVLRLHRHPANIDTLSLQADLKTIDRPDSRPLLATLDGLISQKVTLPIATQAIAAFPELSHLDQAISLALYCWLCTPQYFQLTVRRSQQIQQYLPDLDLTLVPVITGILAGVSMGFECVPPALTPFKQNLPPQLITTANHLFQVWAGMSQSHANPLHLQQAAIAQQGQLKPRTSTHLTLNGNED